VTQSVETCPCGAIEMIALAFDLPFPVGGVGQLFVHQDP